MKIIKIKDIIKALNKSSSDISFDIRGINYLSRESVIMLYNRLKNEEEYEVS